jgi:hypothetical protein
MEIKKVNLDRRPLSSAHIEQKQNFQHVLTNAKMAKPPIWKSPWFYGAVGLSSIAITAISVKEFNNESNVYEKKTTSKNTITEIVKPPKASIQAASVCFPTKLEQKKSVKKTPVSESKKVDEPITLKLDPVASPNEVQSEVVKTPAPKVHSELPSIGGVSNGRISITKFEQAEQIECSEEYKIVSYSIQYFDGRSDLSVQINSEKLPTAIVEEIVANNLDQMIFITGIKGIDASGKIRNLPSMNLKLVR